MKYCRTINVERIAVHPMDDLRNTQFIELIKAGDEPVFSVWVDEEFWEFDMSNPSNYERVKIAVFDAIYACNTMEGIVEVLDDVFQEIFGDILIEDECEGCEGCGYAGNCEYLN